MQIVRTIIWVLILVLLLLFTINNWRPIEVKIWEDLVLETKVPALVIFSFLLGLVPVWLYHRGAVWRFNRRIAALEGAARSAALSSAPAEHVDTPAPALPEQEAQ